MQRSIFGIDIGGANLKGVSLQGGSASCEFPLWQKPHQLARGIVALLSELSNSDAGIAGDAKLAVTMTGELADCFRDKAVGVAHIVDATVAACEAMGCTDPLFYGVDGRFRDANEAKANVDLIAAANWHALASYVATEIVGDGLVIDVGSTTCDVIRFNGQQVDTTSQTDFDRLCAGELVYIGCRRTPVCTLLSDARLTISPCLVPLMNEVFATIDDAALVLGRVAECPDDNDSADQQPRTIAAAINRLARMVGRDHRRFRLNDAMEIADQVVAEAQRRIRHAVTVQLDQSTHLQTKPAPNDQNAAAIVLSGHGQWLLADWIGELLPRSWHTIDLASQLGPDTSRCGPALAVAKLLCKTSTGVSTQ